MIGKHARNQRVALKARDLRLARRNGNRVNQLLEVPDLCRFTEISRGLEIANQRISFRSISLPRLFQVGGDGGFREPGLAPLSQALSKRWGLENQNPAGGSLALDGGFAWACRDGEAQKNDVNE